MAKDPRIEVIPRKPAVCSEGAVVLDVLVRVTPPEPDVHFPRPLVNIALVLDHSGSMGEGKKMSYARQAAAFAVEQLLPTDRVSVTVFDDKVETLVPNGPVTDKPGTVRVIQGVSPRGSTDLHGGWAEGGRQAVTGLSATGGAGAVNRVVLLSDGIANAGVTDPNTIATEVRGLAAKGVGTTTMGMGAQYNEDLLEAMAKAGDGHYYYVETPVQLADIFQTELHGLMAQTGRTVSLGVEPAPGVTVSDVLNDFERLPTGRLKLPNLVVGMPVPVLIRLSVPASAAGTLCAFRLAWDDPETGTRQARRFELGGLPAFTRAAWNGLVDHPDVVDQEALLMAARAQVEASRALERNDIPGTHLNLATAANWLAGSGSAASLEARQSLSEMEEQLDAGQFADMIKKAKFASYSRRHGRSDRHDPPAK